MPQVVFDLQETFENVSARASGRTAAVFGVYVEPDVNSRFLNPSGGNTPGLALLQEHLRVPRGHAGKLIRGRNGAPRNEIDLDLLGIVPQGMGVKLA
jgi:hypothetical protein